MSTCTKCGASLAPDARFCARCGTPVAAEPPAAPPPAPPPPPVIPPPARTAAPPVQPSPPVQSPPSYAPVQPAKRSTWWIVPAVIVGLVVVAWVLLAVLPVGRDEERAEAPPASETIAEGTAAGQAPPITGTLIEVPGEDLPATTETTAPPLQDTTATMAPMSPVPVQDRPPAQTTTTAPPSPSRPQPQPVPPPRQQQPQPPATQTTRPPSPAPRPVTPPPAPPRPAPSTPEPSPSGEISEQEAGSTLRGYITSRNFYEGVSGNCLSIRGHGYRNVGYTFSAWDSCASGGGSRMLGRWRVDSKTREVFRQREDGRFLRP